jgi:hypothetical protein
MKFPVLTLQKQNLAVFDNILTNEEADILGKTVFNKPSAGETDFYYFNQMFSMDVGNTLAYINPARNLLEQVQFRCIQLMQHELQTPKMKIEYSGIAVSTKSYAYHADNSYPLKEENRNLGLTSDKENDFSTFIDNSNEEWTRGTYPLRYYSTILFLNSNFSGGEEVFPQHQLEIQPRQGRLIIFPSTKEYIHGTRRTTNGTRHALYTWYHKVFTYYDQKANEKTKNIDNLRQLRITVEENNLLSNV